MTELTMNHGIYNWVGQEKLMRLYNSLTSLERSQYHLVLYFLSYHALPNIHQAKSLSYLIIKFAKWKKCYGAAAEYHEKHNQRYQRPQKQKNEKIDYYNTSWGLKAFPWRKL